MRLHSCRFDPGLRYQRIALEIIGFEGYLFYWMYSKSTTQNAPSFHIQAKSHTMHIGDVYVGVIAEIFAQLGDVNIHRAGVGI